VPPDAGAELCRQDAVPSAERSFSARAVQEVQAEPQTPEVQPVSEQAARVPRQKRSPKVRAVVAARPLVPEVRAESRDAAAVPRVWLQQEEWPVFQLAEH
jgi:hypothetical protein